MNAFWVLLATTGLIFWAAIRRAQAIDAERTETAEAYAGTAGMAFIVWFGAAVWLLVDIVQAVLA